MHIRHLILALLTVGLLVACSSNPNVSPSNTTDNWDQANFESANWN